MNNAADLASLAALNAKVISRRPVLHRASLPEGTLVIVEVQIVEVMGKRFECNLWANWGDSKSIKRVDSNEVRS